MNPFPPVVGLGFKTTENSLKEENVDAIRSADLSLTGRVCHAE
jgi:hypothetical protein